MRNKDQQCWFTSSQWISASISLSHAGSHCLHEYSISDGAKLFLAHKPPTSTAESGPQQPLREASSASGSGRGDPVAGSEGRSEEGRSEEGRMVLTVKVLKGGREEKIEVTCGWEVGREERDYLLLSV